MEFTKKDINKNAEENNFLSMPQLFIFRAVMLTVVWTHFLNCFLDAQTKALCTEIVATMSFRHRLVFFHWTKHQHNAAPGCKFNCSSVFLGPRFHEPIGFEQTEHMTLGPCLSANGDQLQDPDNNFTSQSLDRHFWKRRLTITWEKNLFCQ